MTNEEKQLLIKDICGRLPYGIKLKRFDGEIAELTPLLFATFAIENFKPYLRPMSSMTEEEYIEFLNTQNWECGDSSHPKYEYTYKTFDWLNANHFDYRGLIPMGLALEAPEGTYIIK